MDIQPEASGVWSLREELSRTVARPGEEAEAMSAAVEEAVPGLEREAGELLDHPDATVQVAALRYFAALGVGPGKWGEAILRLFRHPAPEVREWAVRAASRMRIGRAATHVGPVFDGEVWPGLHPEMRRDLAWLRAAWEEGEDGEGSGDGGMAGDRGSQESWGSRWSGAPSSPAVLEVRRRGVLLRWGERVLTPLPVPLLEFELGGGVSLSSDGALAGSAWREGGELRLRCPLETGPRPVQVEWTFTRGGPGTLTLEAALEAPQGISLVRWEATLLLTPEYSRFRIGDQGWRVRGARMEWTPGGIDEHRVWLDGGSKDGELPLLGVQAGRSGASVQIGIGVRPGKGGELTALGLRSLRRRVLPAGRTSLWQGRLELVGAELSGRSG